MSTLNDKIRERLMLVTGATNSQGTALNDLWFRYLRSMDYTGSLQDMKYDYLTDLVAIPRGAALNDLFGAYLREKGYTGALNDQLYQAWSDGVLAYVDLGFMLYIDEDYALENSNEDYIVHIGIPS